MSHLKSFEFMNV